MRLFVISAPWYLPGEPGILCELFEQGLEYLHVRKPEFSRNEMAGYISEIPRRFHPRLVLHSHHKLAGQFRLGGVHLSGKSCRSGFAEMNLSISKSVHSLRELRNFGGFDYGFLSPVFSSVSKPGYGPAFADEALKCEVPLSKVPLIALGGVTKEKVHLAKMLGFQGVGVLGALWGGAEKLRYVPEILRSFLELAQECRQAENLH